MNKIITSLLMLGMLIFAGCSEEENQTNTDYINNSDNFNETEERERLKEEIKSEIEEENKIEENLKKDISFLKRCNNNIEYIEDKISKPLKNSYNQINVNSNDFNNYINMINECENKENISSSLAENYSTLNENINELKSNLRIKEKEFESFLKKETNECISELNKLKENINSISIDSLNEEFELLEDRCLNINNDNREIYNLMQEIDSLRDEKLSGEFEEENQLEDICSLYKNRLDYDYKYSDYNEYQDFVKDEVQKLVNLNNLGNYGGREARYNGSVYFLYFQRGEWEFYNYIAVEVDAETGELIKYKDITSEDGSRDGFKQIWWTPEDELENSCS